MFAKNMLANFNNIFLANIFYYFKVNPFYAHVSLMEESGWSLLAKFLFRMSLSHICFSQMLLVKTS